MRHPLLPLAAACLSLLCVAPPAAAQAGGRPYVLSPDDQVDITVLGHDDLKESVTVLPDGTFRCPIVGTVHAAGLTVDGLTRSLTRGLSGQLNAPQVTVSVRQSRPRRVSVLGAVKAPGLYDVRPGTHLLDVVAACGGFTQSAQLTQATLVADGGRRSVPVDVPGLLDGTAPGQNLPLEAGDVLLVQARDPAAGQIQVIGEVLKPGAIEVPADGLSVEAVLAETGGATPAAALSQSQILHGGRTDRVNLRALLGSLADPAGRVRLMPGDVLLVPANTAHIAVLGQVKSAGTFPVPDGGSVTVIGALTLSGGPTPDGDRKNAALVRRNAAGGPVVIPINLDDLLRGRRQAADLTLQPGDILYVPDRKQGGGINPLQILSVLPLVQYLHL